MRPEFRKAGLANVLVTNGYIAPEPLRELLPVDAMNIDLKSMDPEFYRRICGGSSPRSRHHPGKRKSTHVEITNLLVTGENDSDESIRTSWTSSRRSTRRPPSTFPGIAHAPVHRPPHAARRLAAAFRIARERLPFVYVGNYRLEGASDTACPSCGSVVVRRHGYAPTGPGFRKPLRFLLRPLRFVV